MINMKKQLIVTIILLTMYTASYGSSTLTKSSRPAMQVATNNLMNTLSTPTSKFTPQSRPVASSPSYVKYPATTSAQFQHRSYSTNNKPWMDMNAVPHENDRLAFVKESLHNLKKDGIKVELSNLDLLKFSNSLLQNCSYQEIADIVTISKQLALKNAAHKKISLKDLTTAHLISIRQEANPHSMHIKLDANDAHLLQSAFHEAGHTIPLIHQSHITRAALMNIKPYAINQNISYGGSVSNRFVYPVETIQNVLEAQPMLNDQATTQDMIVSLAGITSEQMFNFIPRFDNEMLTDKSQILSLLGNFSARDDMEKVTLMIQHLASNQEEAENMLVAYYQATYKFLSQYKKGIKALAQAAINSKSLTLSEDEIYNILGTSVPLERWEHGPLQEKFKNHYEFRKAPQPNTYGYDAQGNYVGTDGYLDQFGSLQEID